MIGTVILVSRLWAHHDHPLRSARLIGVEPLAGVNGDGQVTSNVSVDKPLPNNPAKKITDHCRQSGTTGRILQDMFEGRRAHCTRNSRRARIQRRAAVFIVARPGTRSGGRFTAASVDTEHLRLKQAAEPPTCSAAMRFVPNLTNDVEIAKPRPSPLFDLNGRLRFYRCRNRQSRRVLIPGFLSRRRQVSRPAWRGTVRTTFARYFAHRKPPLSVWCRPPQSPGQLLPDGISCCRCVL